jgi:rhomboid family GlyGly-CTERM serine protease
LDEAGLNRADARSALRDSSALWLLLAAVLMLGSVLVWTRDGARWSWQPELAWAEPWRAWTAAFVHFSGLHLMANLAGAVLVGALGWAARVPLRSSVAWALAWPLTQYGLLVQPALLRYGGLSGVLHAGVVVASIHLLFEGTRTQRRVGAATLLVVGLKVLSETPWVGPLSHPAGWDIAVAPMAHASGLAAGALTALAAQAGHRWRDDAPQRHG